MTLELVPPGHEPTRITPTASSGGSGAILHVFYLFPINALNN